ncbi:MAG: DUF2029 domain-containing protein [Williamsia sp.]|nr:DUF2029 domain-containing protein [Williamsia sp.]
MYLSKTGYASPVKDYIFSGRFLRDRKFVALLWFGLPLFAVLQAVVLHRINTYIIYKWVYFHTVQQVNLYLPYPQEYGDVNLYGPLFSLVIAPFALLPDWLGVTCWVLASAALLWYAISKLPFSHNNKTILLLLCAHELMYTSAWVQTNALICACMILGFAFVNEQKEGRALFFIMAAGFIKIYGLTALVFFLFSKRPLRFIGWGAIWSVVFFFAPLLITSPSFLIQSYGDWYEGLRIKAAKNVHFDPKNFYQDVSVMGMIRRIFNYYRLQDSWILVPAFLLFVSQFLRYKSFSDLRFRLYLLCSVLMGTIIFSSGAEASTYIIALPGICIWYLLQPKTRLTNIFFILVFVLTTFSHSDLITHWFREHVVHRYSLKALPPLVIWITILVQIYKKQFLRACDPFKDTFTPVPAPACSPTQKYY